MSIRSVLKEKKLLKTIIRNALGLIHIVLAMIIMIVVVALSPSFLIYDEVFHLEGAKLLIQGLG